MAYLLDDKTRDQLSEIMDGLPNQVRILFFSQKPESPACKQQRELLQEIAEISDRLTLEMFDFVGDGERANEYGIDKIPATAVVGTKDYGIRFFGITMGYEFSSLVEAIVLASVGRSGLPGEIEEIVRKINEPVHIQVMTTLT